MLLPLWPEHILCAAKLRRMRTESFVREPRTDTQKKIFLGIRRMPMNFAISRESIIISLFATETVYIYTCNGVSIINTESDFCLLFPHLSHLSLRVVLDSVAAVIRRNMTSTLAPECVEKKKIFLNFSALFLCSTLAKKQSFEYSRAPCYTCNDDHLSRAASHWIQFVCFTFRASSEN